MNKRAYAGDGRHWTVGDAIVDDDYHLAGRVIDIEDYGGGHVVIHVRWDVDGSCSGFTPDGQTRQIDRPEEGRLG